VLSKLWRFLSSLTYITLLSLISVNTPGIVKDFSGGLMGLTQLDSVNMDKTVEDQLIEFNDADDVPLNGEF